MPAPRLLVVLLAVFLAACSKGPPPVVTDDGPLEVPQDAPFWPRFHGPQGENISTDVGLLSEWPQGGPPLVWTAEGIGHGYAGVTASGGLIYTAGNMDGYTMVTALRLDGRVRWRKPNGDAWEKSSAGTRGTPTVDGDRLYHQSPLGELTCFDAKSGQKVWGLNALDKFGGRNIQWGLSESVLIDGDWVICCPGGEIGMAAVDKRTGQTVWTAPCGGDKAGYASPAIVEHKGLRMILTMTAKALIGVDADAGELLFRHQHQTQYDVNVLMPIFHDGCVFVSSGYNTGSQMLRINVDGKKANVDEVWSSPEMDNHHGGVMLIDGHLYGSCHRRHGGGWVCLDFSSGELKHAQKGVGKGSLTCADGLFYILSEKGEVGLVKPTPTAHQVISRFKIPSAGDDPSWAHPVVIGGRLYIRHNDRLYAYDVRAKQ